MFLASLLNDIWYSLPWGIMENKIKLIVKTKTSLRIFYVEQTEIRKNTWKVW